MGASGPGAEDTWHQEQSNPHHNALESHSPVPYVGSMCAGAAVRWSLLVTTVPAITRFPALLMTSWILGGYGDTGPLAARLQQL